MFKQGMQIAVGRGKYQLPSASQSLVENGAQVSNSQCSSHISWLCCVGKRADSQFLICFGCPAKAKVTAFNMPMPLVTCFAAALQLSPSSRHPDRNDRCRVVLKMEFLCKGTSCRSTSCVSVKKQRDSLLCCSWRSCHFPRGREEDRLYGMFCTGAYRDLLALTTRTRLVSFALNALVTMAGTRGIQNGPRPELVQIPLKKMTTRDH